jgi:uncharacterized integral membrane protein
MSQSVQERVVLIHPTAWPLPLVLVMLLLLLLVVVVVVVVVVVRSRSVRRWSATTRTKASGTQVV